MTEEEIKKHVAEIDEIYKSYLGKLFDLKKEQDAILADLEKVLTSDRMQEIKNSLGII
ncbi:MAG: hypothetical protein WAV46_00145 [Candidatus Moraniibacteriota bacterium]